MTDSRAEVVEAESQVPHEGSRTLLRRLSPDADRLAGEIQGLFELTDGVEADSQVVEEPGPDVGLIPVELRPLLTVQVQTSP